MRFELRTPTSQLIARPHPVGDRVELMVIGEHIEKIELDRSAVLSLTKELLDLSAEMGGRQGPISRR